MFSEVNQETLVSNEKGSIPYLVAEKITKFALSIDYVENPNHIDVLLRPSFGRDEYECQCGY